MIPEDVLPKTHWQGDIHALAVKVRRMPMLARELHLVHLVQAISERWREAADLYTVSDEAPVTAWIIRRKSDLVLPQDEPEDDEIESVVDDPADMLWLSEGVSQLQEALRLAQRYHERLVSEDAMDVYHPVKGASVAKLIASWPHLRTRKTVPALHHVAAEEDPLERRIHRVWEKVHQAVDGVSFGEVVQSHTPHEVVGTFLAVVHLWHQNRLTVIQEMPFEEMWLCEVKEGT
ncbi:MAG: hypothetical protein C7B44_08945 [Sulfobacillus thermosulfidooxidans]|uniref:Segregation and condensation protein A n=1 Tax=Sulfobacillus thermotolerans TaxID=338644 RepID=A0ABN5GZ53_9FIRM|nr:hypothetical protein BXT84_06490 [Sulfobacillus thermotolerans]MCY0907018.1 hypothetical protein [Sulfobacillus thermotolerans]POB10877.1 hypothetical protein CO251_08720 [Sulfobacillus sp. hq2]PSR36458.1 MAG: hypothetical protein C7B44_08945 [Sulfobacillus thermosulfidooxidans]